MTILIQDHTPCGIASQYFGSVIQRFSKNLDRNISYESLINEVLNGYCIYKFYTIPSTVRKLAEQAKSHSMFFAINNNSQWFNKDISPDFYGKISGACADVLDMLGFSKNKAAILLMNEPHKFGNENWYLDCVDWSNYYVKGRYKLILINDEYPCYNNDYILENTGYIKDRIFGVHLLSCLGYPPEMKIIEFAATTAAKYGIPVICTEGGSWFKSYRTYEGWEVIRKLIEKCSQLKYYGCAIVCPDNNTEGLKYYPKLGFRIWDKYYKKIIKLSKYWDDFEKLLKEIKEKVPEEELIIKGGKDGMIIRTIGFKNTDLKSGYPVLLVNELLYQNNFLSADKVGYSYTEDTKQGAIDFIESIKVKYPNDPVKQLLKSDGRIGRQTYRYLVEEIPDLVERKKYQFAMQIMTSPINLEGAGV